MIESNDKEEIDIIYLQTITIADFIIDKDKVKQEVIPGMNDIVISLRDTIDQTYKKRDKRGMNLIFNDFKEMMKELSEQELFELASIFEKNNVSFSLR